MKTIASFLASMAMAASAVAQPEVIKLNQVGYAPESEKTATIELPLANGKPLTVTIINPYTGQPVWKGKTSRSVKSPFSDKVRQVVDFSDFKTTGSFELVVGDKTNTHKVDLNIIQRPYAALSVASIKAFYYQRTGEAILPQFGGKWARPASHTDTLVYIHPSAATAERPAGSTISSPAGWYDAGDYNKYIVNSGYAVGAMMFAYEHNKAYYKQLQVSIPESDNSTPDLLDEIYFNLKWMQTMQDTDGGVYHKLTTPNFEAFVAPTDCHQKRYVVQKGTAATLDFAASLAQASRLFSEYSADYPGFSAQALAQAEKAYQWAKKNPKVTYNQDKMNKEFAPDVNTGAYGDNSLNDEFFWAATELYLATGKDEYRQEALNYKPQGYSSATWGNVAELGMLEWVDKYSNSTLVSEKTIANDFKARLLDFLKPFVDSADNSCFVSPCGNRAQDFFWGCNAESFAWRGVQMLYAYKLTGEAKYKLNAQRCLNSLLGQNATGFCFVSGFGSKPTSHPHHRLAASNPYGALPGFLAGGPNPGQQDKAQIKYPTAIPDESYIDDQNSYASNEIAINWNANLVALAGWIDALQSK